MKLSPTFRAQMRGNFALALIPLGLALIARGLEELDALVQARYAVLEDLDARIIERRGEVGAQVDPDADAVDVRAQAAAAAGCPPDCDQVHPPCSFAWCREVALHTHNGGVDQVWGREPVPAR